jgi:hypothetical protein
VKGRFVRSAVRAEVRRALRAGREIDREYLRDETGLAWNRLERLISEASRDLASSTAGPVEDGGVEDRAATPAPTLRIGRFDPFAPPTEWPVPKAMA